MVRLLQFGNFRLLVVQVWQVPKMLAALSRSASLYRFVPPLLFGAGPGLTSANAQSPGRHCPYLVPLPAFPKCSPAGGQGVLPLPAIVSVVTPRPASSWG